MRGAARVPTAAKESDALIWVRVQPKVSSSGSMKCPNAYCVAPIEIDIDRNAAEAASQPRSESRDPARSKAAREGLDAELVLEDLLSGQAVQLVGEDQPALRFMDVVVGLAIGAVVARLVVDGGNPGCRGAHCAGPSDGDGR